MGDNNNISLDKCINQSIYSLRSMLQGHNSHNKKQKLETAIPVLTGLLQSNMDKKLGTKIVILFDSGASQSIVNQKVIDDHLLVQQPIDTKWNTVAGTFMTK